MPGLRRYPLVFPPSEQPVDAVNEDAEPQETPERIPFLKSRPTAPAPPPSTASAPTIEAPPPVRPPNPAPRPVTAKPTKGSKALAALLRGASAFHVVALFASLAWALGFAAFAIVYHEADGPFHLGPFGYVLLAVIAAAPLGLIWAAAAALAQAANLMDEARRSRALTDQLAAPAILAAAQAGDLMDQVRGRIVDAGAAAQTAGGQIAKLQAALAAETQRLTEATSTAETNSQRLLDRLASQRAELDTVSVTLEARAAAVTDAVNRQASMIAEAAEVADKQLQDAETSLAATTRQLEAVSEKAGEISSAASADLARQAARLETAAIGVGDQLRAMEEGLTQQRAGLVTVAHTLRADHEEFAALAETRTAKLAEFLGGASRDVAALNEAATLGAQSMAQLVEEAARKFGELAAAAKAERDHFGAAAAQSLTTLADAGSREKEGLEERMAHTLAAMSDATASARRAAETQSEAARAQIEQLHEAAFAAGQKAEQVFEARLAEARGLIEQSAHLIEDATAATAAKLDAGLSQARTSLEDLGRMVNEVRAAAAGLPEETQQRIADVRAAIDKGMGDLLGAAQRTAKETVAIDEAFQARVKRNYEMLSEAVQLMGKVAQGGHAAAVVQRPAVPRQAAGPIGSQPAESAPRGAVPSPAPPALPPSSMAEAADLSLRPRLKLTPAESATAQPASARLESSGREAAPAAPARSDWSWRALLKQPGAGEEGVLALGDGLFKEITVMGVDPAALLSRGRVAELAAAIQHGDRSAAREVVRNLAPAAVRRISRRFLSDAGFGALAGDYARRFETLLETARSRDGKGFETTALLATDQGRAFLLLDASART